MPVIKMTTTSPKEIKEKITELETSMDGLSRLRNHAVVIQEKCSDITLRSVSLSNLAMFCTNGVIKARYSTPETSLSVRELTPYALGQLCTKLGIPSQYMQKCAMLGYDSLVEDNFNTYIDCYGKDLLIREYGKDTIRGILSDKYSIFDSPDVIDVVDDSTKGMDMKLKSYYISPDRLHARLIQTEPMKIDGEDLFGGIQIDSSDVGRSVLSVNFFIFKQICTNGLCIAKGKANLFTQKHIAICADDFREELSNSLKLFPDLVAEYEAVIKRSRMSSNFIGATKPIMLSDPKNLQELVEKVKSFTKLSDEGANKVLKLAGEKYSYSDWGIINSITEVAQDYTLERRIELEKIAANLLRGIA